MRIDRLRKVAIVGVVIALLPLGVPRGAEADVATCIGLATVQSTTPPTTTGGNGANSTTVVRFDFTGIHDLCLADGTVVVASMAGSMRFVTHANGTGLLTIQSTLSVPGGTIDGMVRAEFTPTTFNGSVHGFHGTGVLAGMSGHGTTYPTGPSMFISHVDYRYA